MKTSFFTCVLLLFTLGVTAQESSRKSAFNLSNGLAIQGYDPVSYFKGAPKEGKSEYSYTYKSVTYRFSSEANKTTFKSNPEKYEPQYGGWCAYAMGHTGEKVEVNPKTYKIVDGKLYLFYNAYFTNTLTDWNKNEKALKTKADKNWLKYYKN